MGSDPLPETPKEIRAFFRKSAHEWARGLDLHPLDVPQAFAQETRRMRLAAADITDVLVAGGQGDGIQVLVQGAPTDLLTAVCPVLTKLLYAPALPWLRRKYRGAAPESKQSILEFVAAVGDASVYRLVREASGDAHPEVRDRAAYAEKAILERVRPLRVIAALASSDLAAAGKPSEEMVADVAEHLAEYVSLSEALATVRTVMETAPVWATRLMDAVTRLSRPGRPPGAAGVSRLGLQQASLIVAAQPGELPSANRKTASRAFARASKGDRSLVLRSAGPAGAAILEDLIESGAPQNLERALSHLETDCPDLVDALSEPLCRLAVGFHLEMCARAGALILGRLAPTDVQGHIAQRLTALLPIPEVGAHRPGMLDALLLTEVGREKLSRTALDRGVWETLAQRLERPQAGAAREAFFAQLLERPGEMVSPAAAIWACRAASGLNEDLVARHSAGLAELVALAWFSSSAAETNALADALRTTPALVRHLLPRVVATCVSLDPHRSSECLRSLAHAAASSPNALDAMGATLLASISGALDAFAEAYRACPEGVAQWRAATEVGQRLGPLLLVEAEHTREAIRLTAYRYAAEDKTDRTRLEKEANDVLDALEALSSKVTSRDGSVAELSVYIDELSEALFSSISALDDEGPSPLGVSEDPLIELVQTLLSRQAAEEALTDRRGRLRLFLVESAALAIEKVLLALLESPERAAISAPLRCWIESLDVSLVEPDLGATVAFSPDRHACRGAAHSGRPVKVLTWGFRAPDGSVVRRAIVSGRQLPGE